MIERAETADVQGRAIRIPSAADLILLKLAAGGPLDQQDVIRLLAFGPRESLVHEVDAKIADLPADARQLWMKILAETKI